MKIRSSTPPRAAQWILKTVSRGDVFIERSGDMEEVYRHIFEASGPFHAGAWFWLQAVKTTLMSLLNTARWRLMMFKNYLKIAFRNFRKNRYYSVINIVGLALGMACCILIMMWVLDELNYERFHINLDQIQCVVQWSVDDQTKSFNNSLPAPLIPYLKATYPEIKYATRFRISGRRLFSYEGVHRFEEKGGFADPELFKLFSFQTIMNDPEIALADLNSIILTKSMAERYFGDDDPVGKVIRLENSYDFMVSAVIEDVPETSSIHFDYLLAFENYGRFDGVEMYNWGRHEQYRGYVILNEYVDVKTFSQKIINGIVENKANSMFRLALFPFKHLRLFGLNNNGSFRYVLVFSAIAVMVLLIACINFINLATAQSGKRAKEIGLRKTMGAGRTSIRRQIYAELGVTVSVAFMVAVLLALLFLPILNRISGKILTLSITQNTQIWIGLLFIALVTAVISGLYPAYYLSSVTPIYAMKLHLTKNRKKTSLRKLLVITQFVISIGLIISTIVIGRQIHYVRNKALGFDKDHLVYVELLGELKTSRDAVKSELLRHPQINAVTVSGILPNHSGSYAGGLDWEGKPADRRGGMAFISTDKDYFRTVGVEFVEGRSFLTMPKNQILAEFILNEKAVESMQIENPVGKMFKMWDRPPGRIIGIVKNVHNVSLHQEIKPAFYVQFPYFYSYLIVNISMVDLPLTIDFIRDVCKRFNPHYPFEFHLLDENIEKSYLSERQIGTIVSNFTLLAVFISCLGLFGLSLFMAEQRTKEIGIRKTLGATVSQIVLFMSRDFLVLVLIANLVAWPMSYIVMKKWLENFTYRMRFGIWIFVLSACIGILIAFLTISYQAVKAARANPAESLKYE